MDRNKKGGLLVGDRPLATETRVLPSSTPTLTMVTASTAAAAAAAPGSEVIETGEGDAASSSP